ncbi:hypothetical protein PHYSODRAFT_294743 [Phytophthora sojae]|uniref:Uncharacterized protein n=1 Tax=Phytophthora sojae (strain P6497) TaxID=1094619 RepID=G4YJC8_PHYSP|nr:hypothetical protein PHYSODRAFT_294743 [Phytophthora sojae]EGZ29725.1 hypothetical protein PHYSODRAFT_294743 [Phytophthora sojae]|eukprot:XP_009517000.1 hypothetical protein PHYSODRAFT_294743 [Phytophthora sojae]
MIDLAGEASEGAEQVGEDGEVAEHGVGKQREEAVVVPPQLRNATSRRSHVLHHADGSEGHGYRSRQRKSANSPVTVQQHDEGLSKSISVPIPLFPDDIASVKEGSMLTCPVVDFCVSCYTPKTAGAVFPMLSITFVEINTVYTSSEDRQPEAITGAVDWSAYNYYLLPVVMDRH